MAPQRLTAGRLAMMIGFSLSVFGLLLFLWLSFGGPTPLRPEGYRIQVPFADAAQLVEEADVRISGLDVGKVKVTETQQRPPRTIATLEIDARYAPLPEGTRATLRQKTILGETYVELAPGRGKREIPDGGRLPEGAVRPAVEFDELFEALDPETRKAFGRWQRELAASVAGGGGADLSAALANLPGVAGDGSALLEVLDRREQALRRFVRNTGVVFEALSERDRIRELIEHSDRLFATAAARDDALGEAVAVLPAFLGESRALSERLQAFAADAKPLVDDLRPVARELTPALRSVADLSPDLEDLFGDLEALNALAPRTLPDVRRFLGGSEPVFEALVPFLQELNPILSFLNYNAPQISSLFAAGAPALQSRLDRSEGEGLPIHALRLITIVDATTLAGMNKTRPATERGNAYLGPDAHLRRRQAGILESFDCRNAGGEQRNPRDGVPPCLVAPKSLWDGRQFPRVEQGKAPVVSPPREER